MAEPNLSGGARFRAAERIAASFVVACFDRCRTLARETLTTASSIASIATIPISSIDCHLDRFRGDVPPRICPGLGHDRWRGLCMMCTGKFRLETAMLSPSAAALGIAAMLASPLHGTDPASTVHGLLARHSAQTFQQLAKNTLSAAPNLAIMRENPPGDISSTLSNLPIMRIDPNLGRPPTGNLPIMQVDPPSLSAPVRDLQIMKQGPTNMPVGPALKGSQD
jgi:hypothetical protein